MQGCHDWDQGCRSRVVGHTATVRWITSQVDGDFGDQRWQGTWALSIRRCRRRSKTLRRPQYQRRTTGSRNRSKHVTSSFTVCGRQCLRAMPWTCCFNLPRGYGLTWTLSSETRTDPQPNHLQGIHHQSDSLEQTTRGSRGIDIQKAVRMNVLFWGANKPSAMKLLSAQYVSQCVHVLKKSVEWCSVCRLRPTLQPRKKPESDSEFHTSALRRHMPESSTMSTSVTVCVLAGFTGSVS